MLERVWFSPASSPGLAAEAITVQAPRHSENKKNSSTENAAEELDVGTPVTWSISSDESESGNSASGESESSEADESSSEAENELPLWKKSRKKPTSAALPHTVAAATRKNSHARKNTPHPHKGLSFLTCIYDSLTK